MGWCVFHRHALLALRQGRNRASTRQAERASFQVTRDVARRRVSSFWVKVFAYGIICRAASAEKWAYWCRKSTAIWVVLYESSQCLGAERSQAEPASEDSNLERARCDPLVGFSSFVALHQKVMQVGHRSLRLVQTVSNWCVSPIN